MRFRLFKGAYKTPCPKSDDSLTGGSIKYQTFAPLPASASNGAMSRPSVMRAREGRHRPLAVAREAS